MRVGMGGGGGGWGWGWMGPGLVAGRRRGKGFVPWLSHHTKGWPLGNQLKPDSQAAGCAGHTMRPSAPAACPAQTRGRAQLRAERQCSSPRWQFVSCVVPPFLLQGFEVAQRFCTRVLDAAVDWDQLAVVEDWKGMLRWGRQDWRLEGWEAGKLMPHPVTCVPSPPKIVVVPLLACGLAHRGSDTTTFLHL